MTVYSNYKVTLFTGLKLDGTKETTTTVVHEQSAFDAAFAFVARAPRKLGVHITRNDLYFNGDYYWLVADSKEIRAYVEKLVDLVDDNTKEQLTSQDKTFGYMSQDCSCIQSPLGDSTPIMRVTDMHRIKNRFVDNHRSFVTDALYAVKAVDVNGQRWYGRTCGACMSINLRKCRKQ